MPAGNAADGNPVSLAMELSQKDEASKLAMTANAEKAMGKGLSSEGAEKEAPVVSEGLSVFQDFAQGFSAMSLLEEVSIPELQR